MCSVPRLKLILTEHIENGKIENTLLFFYGGTGCLAAKKMTTARTHRIKIPITLGENMPDKKKD